MAWIRIPRPEEAQGELRAAYDSIAHARGKIADVVAVHGLNPPVMRAMMDLYLAVMYGPSPLTRAQRELIATAVSAANACDYCVAHHAEALRIHAQDDALVAEISEDPRRANLPPRDQALVEYALRLTHRPESMSEDDVRRLRDAGFDDRAILDANVVASLFAYFNRIVLGLGVELEPDRGAGYKY